MTDAINMLYRLFAPLFVVIVIIVGVDLGADLVKNSQERQSAISIAYAGGCPAGSIPVPQSCTARDSKGNIIPKYCFAEHKVAGIISGVCTEWQGTGCCLGSKWPSASESAAAQSGTQGATSTVLGKLMESVMGMLQGGGGGSSYDPNDTNTDADNKPKPPVCTKLSASTSLPLRSGESATLTWILDGGKPDSVIITPGIGAVNGFSVRVTPRISTTYTVVAKNEGGTSTCPKVRVYVGPREDGDGIFTDDSPAGSNGDVDIWSDGAAGGAQNTNPNSAYDNLWDESDRPVDRPQDIKDNDDYYDFLNSLATAYDNNAPQLSAQQGGEYYYGDDDTSWSDFANNSPSWDNVDVQDGQDYPTDTLGYYGARSSTFGQGSGLTDEEIYGIWNRPQNPSTGGLGPSGGYDDVGTWDDADEVGILTRFGRWIKGIFCFWCSPSA